MTDAAPARRARAPRTLVQKLAPAVLGFEAIVVFLAGLTIFGLKRLPEPLPQWWAIVGGAILGLLMILTAGLITKRGAIGFGWFLQAVVTASAILVPAILLVTVVFGGMWAYATIMGARIDQRVAAQHSAGTTPQTDSATPTESE